MYQYHFKSFFEKTCEKFNQKVALIDTDEKKYTYNYLNKKSDIVASNLERFKGKTNTIAIDSIKNVNTIIMFLGCLKIGFTYFFLDLNQPKKRIQLILKKTKCKLIITEKKTHNLKVNSISPKNLMRGKQNKTSNYTSDNSAYIMFTSGSTGEPKGAIINHQSIINFVNWSKNSFEISEKDIFSQLNPLYFDNSVFDLYNSLLHGCTLVLTNGLDIKKPVHLLKRLKKNKCTIWFSTPSLLIYYLNFGLINKANFLHFKKIIFGGEGFPKPKLINLINKMGNKKYYNVYGPTECTCICSSHLITSRDLKKDEEKYVTLGNIAENFNYEIDSKNKSYKNKKIGELLLFGPNVGLGYIGDKKITSENFILDEKKFNSRGYKTGDLVYLNKKRNKIFFVGRKDTQIKHLGHRIELNELEVTLNKNPSVDEACVFYFKKKFNTYGKIIAVISSKKNINKFILLKFIKKFLPNYFLPQEIFIVKNLKKNFNGKIDRNGIKKFYEKLLSNTTQ